MSVKIVGHNRDVITNDGNAAIKEGINGGKLINKWTVDDVSNWLNSIGFNDCVQVFQAHSISGPVVPRLTPDLLREMGIQSVGRRMELQSQILTVQAKARTQWRNEVLWASEMYRAGPCNGAVPYGFPFCCECMTGLPATYRVTNSKVNIQRHRKIVPMCGCCGFAVASENLDLSDIRDVDVAAMTAAVGDPPGTITVNGNSKSMQLILKSSECQKAAAIITHAKEEAVVQEGLQRFGRG